MQALSESHGAPGGFVPPEALDSEVLVMTVPDEAFVDVVVLALPPAPPEPVEPSTG